MIHFINYLDANDNDVILKEIGKLNRSDGARIVLKLEKIMVSGLTSSNYKRFKGYPENIVVGEFIIGDFRIFNYRKDETTFVLLRLFRKQTNETPKSETDLAWKRLIDYLSRQKPL